MYEIAFYLSDHGFGHVSRNIPIIRYILQTKHNIKVHIKTGIRYREFLEASFKDLINFSNIVFDYKDLDLGLILKNNTLEIDNVKLEDDAIKFIKRWPKLIEEEKKYLNYNNIKLVVSDIVPWIFKATNDLNIKSILISNFTWVDIYNEHISLELCKEFENCYKMADKVYLYYLSMESMKKYIKNYEYVGLVSREFNDYNVKNIKDSFNKKIVFISVGGSVSISRKIDVKNLNFNFIVTEGLELTGDNVKYLSRNANNTHEYIKASDYVITKGGWSTTAECLISKRKIAFFSRKSVSEDRNTINKLVSNGLAIEINDFNIEKAIKNLEKLKKKFKFKNDYKNIGEKIISCIL